MRKPGALRNGAPFKDWDLPESLAQVRAKLKPFVDGDRQFVKILAAVPACRHVAGLIARRDRDWRPSLERLPLVGE
jgi:hypothetical protein